MSPDSNYHSPLRDQAKLETRVRILDALVRVVLDDGIHAFSVANVARRAGISHRTVYRHFASREELLEGLGDRLEESGRDLGFLSGLPITFDEIPDLAELMFDGLGRLRDQAEAEFITAVALRYSMRGKSQRWAQLQEMVAETFPRLTPDEQLEGAAALRALLSTSAWFHLCVQLGLKEAVAGRGTARAARLVIEDLERRNAALEQR